METVAEALSRHEADCPVCQSGHSKRCLERETIEELAELRAELAALRRVPCIDCHGTGKCACGDCKDQTCALCGGVGQTAALTHDDVACEMQRLRSRLTDAEAERDRYLTRACVAEAKVAKVLELVTPWAPAQQEPVLMLALATGNLGRAHLAQEILTAIGGKP